MRVLAGIIAVAASLAAPTAVRAVEVEAGVNGVMYFGCCAWSLRIRPDGATTVDVSPAAHLSRRFTLSAAKMNELETVLTREAFLSLDEKLGVLVLDGNGAWMQVKLAGRERSVRLSNLPFELRELWKSDPGQLGRAFRTCEYLRAVTGVADALHCPGIPESSQ